MSHARARRATEGARSVVSSLMPRTLIARAVDRDAGRRHWLQLSRCEGFRVWTSRGKLGVVEKVVVEEWGEPRKLVVRRGPIRRRRATIPVRDVVLVDVDRRSVFAEVRARRGSSAPGPAALRQIRDR
jgi:hypothetical protein